MSTDYCPLRKVPACDLFDGRLEEFGVREHVKPEATTEKSRLLTDGRNYLWVSIDDDGFVGRLTRYAPNGAPGKILNALANVFDTDIVTEYEPQFWGFDTQEEWKRAWKNVAEVRGGFIELLKYLQSPTTSGQNDQMISRDKNISRKNHRVSAVGKQSNPRNEIQSIYDREQHCRYVDAQSAKRFRLPAAKWSDKWRSMPAREASVEGASPSTLVSLRRERRSCHSRGVDTTHGYLECWVVWHQGTGGSCPGIGEWHTIDRDHDD